jgi:cell division protein FtsB
VIALIPIVVYSVAVVAEKSLETYRLRQEALVLRGEIEAEKQKNLRLQQELVEARSDQQIEESARRHLNLIKPGDQPVVLTGHPPPATPTPRTIAGPAAPEVLPEWLTWLLERVGR